MKRSIVTYYGKELFRLADGRVTAIADGVTAEALAQIIAAELEPGGLFYCRLETLKEESCPSGSTSTS